MNVKDKKAQKARSRTTKGHSSRIEPEELMDFGSERERGDSVGLQNYLLYQRLKGEDVSISDTKESRRLDNRTGSVEYSNVLGLSSSANGDNYKNLAKRR